MPTQRANGRFYIKPKVPGVGQVYRTLGTDRKGLARRREDMLLALARQGHQSVIRAWLEGDIDLAEVQESFERGKVHEIAEDLRRGTPTVAEAARAALRYKAPDVQDSTLDRYRTGLDHFLDFVGPDTEVADVLPDETIQRFKGHRLDEGLAEQTVNNDLGAVSILVTYAYEKKDWIPERPEIKRFKYKARIRWLDRGQFAAYMAALRPPFRVQQQLLLGTGMRLGESEALRVCDLRFNDTDNRAMIEDAKTDTGVRTVFVPAWVAGAVTEHIQSHGLRGTDHLFTIDRRTVQAEHNRACEIAGIAEYTIHDHRHSAAVHLARAGIPLNLLQQQLGHKHIDMTMKYSRFHPDYSDVAAYFERVGERLGLRSPGNVSGNGTSGRTREEVGADAG